MLAAGGTGGHLFPAMALAQELQRRGIAVELVTDMRAEKYGADFPARRVHRVPSATLVGRSLGAITRTAVTLTRGVAQAFKLIGEVRPQVIVGFGGYPTVPPLVAARLRGVPSILHEQNAVLGRANRALARRATVIATSFETVRGLEPAFATKVRFTGNPVRDSVTACAGIPYSAPVAGRPISLLIFGGSQGARFFSDIMPAALALLAGELRQRLFVVQQAREEDVARVEAAYAASGIRANVAAFFTNLPDEMARASLVVARAGASTVAELTAIGRPSILVPLPNAIDNDQFANARRLDEAGAAVCLEQKDATAERFAGEFADMFAAPDALAAAAAAAKAQGRPDAVARLADLVVGYCG